MADKDKKQTKNPQHRARPDSSDLNETEREYMRKFAETATYRDLMIARISRRSAAARLVDPYNAKVRRLITQLMAVDTILSRVQQEILFKPDEQMFDLLSATEKSLFMVVEPVAEVVNAASRLEHKLNAQKQKAQKNKEASQAHEHAKQDAKEPEQAPDPVAGTAQPDASGAAHDQDPMGGTEIVPPIKKRAAKE